MPLIPANGIELFYDFTGPAEASVVVFSNSIATPLEMWDDQVKALSGRYRCLRYDTRGHGRSPVVDRSITIDDLADDLAGLLDALGIEQAHVVGLSLGGMTAQAFGVRHAGRARSLTLMATTARMPEPQAWAERAAFVREKGLGPLVDQTMSPRWFTPRFVREAPEKVAFIRSRFLATDPRTYALCCEVIAKLDLDERIGAITAPTLVMAGAEDPGTPVEAAQKIHSLIVGSELVVIPAAHQFAIEQPTLTTEHLARFLDRVGGNVAGKSG